jgi:hypothetical protein
MLYTGSYAHYQWYLNGYPIAGATNSVYYESAPGVYKVEVTDGSGCSLTSVGHSISGGSGSAVPTVSAAEVRYYPNPATNELRVDAPVQVTVRILSPDGKVNVETHEASVIDISNLSAGVYIIMVYDGSGLLIRTGKFIKMD